MIFIMTVSLVFYGYENGFCQYTTVLLKTAIDLITMLMKDSPEHSPSFAFIFQNIFPNLIQMLIVTGNNSILQVT